MKSERAYLEHILQCIRRILEDSSGGKEAVFASPTLQDAILRNLQILCESTQRLAETSKNRHPEVDWPAISGLRNVLVHDYFAVDWEMDHHPTGPSSSGARSEGVAGRNAINLILSSQS